MNHVELERKPRIAVLPWQVPFPESNQAKTLDQIVDQTLIDIPVRNLTSESGGTPKNPVQSPLTVSPVFVSLHVKGIS